MNIAVFLCIIKFWGILRYVCLINSIKSGESSGCDRGFGLENDPSVLGYEKDFEFGYVLHIPQHILKCPCDVRISVSVVLFPIFPTCVDFAIAPRILFALEEHLCVS